MLDRAAHAAGHARTQYLFDSDDRLDPKKKPGLLAVWGYEDSGFLPHVYGRMASGKAVKDLDLVRLFPSPRPRPYGAPADSPVSRCGACSMRRRAQTGHRSTRSSRTTSPRTAAPSPTTSSTAPSSRPRARTTTFCSPRSACLTSCAFRSLRARRARQSRVADSRGPCTRAQLDDVQHRRGDQAAGPRARDPARQARRIRPARYRGVRRAWDQGFEGDGLP